MVTFRFDDVCGNTDAVKLTEAVTVIRAYVPEVTILFAWSPVIFERHQLPEDQWERVHPRILTAQSDITAYYRGMDACSPPYLLRKLGVVWAGHGLAHVDHRLLARDAQEMSIVMSCAIARATTFVPPYNKWNTDTIGICKHHGITLVRFEDGWRHVGHNPFHPRQSLYYLHPYDRTPEQLASWFTRPVETD